MTHHDGDTPANGTDQDCTLSRTHFGTGDAGPTLRPAQYDRIDDDLLNVETIYRDSVGSGSQQVLEELVSRLIREGEALRTELGLPGFPSADAPPCASPTGTPEQSLADHADGTIPEMSPVHADVPEAHDHRTPQRRAPRRFRGRERKVSAPEWGTVLADVSAEPGWRCVRLGLATRLLMKCLGSVVRDTASEGVRRMVTRHKADLVLWFCVLYGSIVLTGNVAFSVPTWLGTASLVLLPAAAAWWRHLREDVHEPGLDQHPAPPKDDQRT